MIPFSVAVLTLEMHSKFVTNLKYAFHNDETLFLVLDLMEGRLIIFEDSC